MTLNYKSDIKIIIIIFFTYSQNAVTLRIPTHIWVIRVHSNEDVAPVKWEWYNTAPHWSTRLKWFVDSYLFYSLKALLHNINQRVWLPFWKKDSHVCYAKCYLKWIHWDEVIVIYTVEFMM